MTKTPIEVLNEGLELVNIDIVALEELIATQNKTLEEKEHLKEEFEYAIGIILKPNIDNLIGDDNENIAPNISSITDPMIYSFDESTPKGNIKWGDVSLYKNIETSKADGHYKLSSNGNRIVTTWDYLNAFFDKLLPKTTMYQISGINIKKASALFKFYEAHPNFHCHIEFENKKMCLVKDEIDVFLDIDTKGGDPAIEFEE